MSRQHSILNRACLALIAGLLLSCSVIHGVARANEPTPPSPSPLELDECDEDHLAPPPESTIEPSKPEVVPPPEDGEPSIWDRYHLALGGRLNMPIIWFDNFFGDPRTEDEELPTSFIRWRTGLQFTEGKGFTYPIRLHANVRLPKASRRLRLIITGENEDELLSGQTGGNSTPGLETQQEDNATNVGLRYTLYRTLRDKLHFGGGLQLGWPVEYYVRLRYRRLLHIGKKNLFRFTETGFWHSVDQLGETTRIDFERSHTPKVSSRFSIYGTYSEVSEGVDWGMEESIFLQLTPKTAISLDLAVEGDTRPTPEVNNYHIGTRYRKNFYRPWLFFEVRPEVNFPLHDSGERSTVGALLFVLEVQFIREDEKD